MANIDTSFSPPRFRWPAKSQLSSAGKRVAEFLAVGGATLLLLPFAIWGPEDSAFGFTGFAIASMWLVYVLNDPHFAASYVIFYRDIKNKLTGNGYAFAEQWRYWSAGIVMPSALIGWIAISLITETVWMMSFMVQLMFILVGWHYIKQGFGVLIVLSARRGVFFSGWDRRILLTHAYSAWAYAWSNAERYAISDTMDGVPYSSFQTPDALFYLCAAVFWTSGAAMIVLLVRKFWTERKIPPVTPFTGFFVTIYLWQVLFGEWEALAFLIPALHSLQYLVFVSHLEVNRSKDKSRGQKPWVWPARIAFFTVTSLGLGWLLFHGAPDHLDNTVEYNWEVLGPTIFLAAISTFVNIHHYLMDNVIWRRGNPDMAYLK